MRRLAFAALLACSCASPTQAPPGRRPIEAPRPVASAAPPPTAARSSEPAPKALGPQRCAGPEPKANGVVPMETIEALGSGMIGQQPGLERAAACVAALAPGGDGSAAETCAWDPPALLGFDPALDRVAALALDSKETAGEGCDGDAGEILDSTSWRPVAKSARFDCKRAGLARNEFADAIAKRGFVPARNLVEAQSVDAAGATWFAPLARLDAPLCGYMLQAKPNGKSFEIMLIAATNDWSEKLGTMPLVVRGCPAHLRIPGGCAVETSFHYARVREVALTPDRRRIVVGLGATPGGHNEPVLFGYATFKLPARVVAAP